jgi:hypothetical protein
MGLKSKGGRKVFISSMCGTGVLWNQALPFFVFFWCGVRRLCRVFQVYQYVWLQTYAFA